MKVGKKILCHFMLALSLASLVTGPVSAQKSPEKIRLTPESKDGAVLIRVATIPAPYRLVLHKTGRAGFGSRVYAVFANEGRGEEVYIARTLEPGTYQLDSIIQQLRWVLPFKRTVEIEIKPGKISYLGSLNTKELLTALQDQAIAAGRTVVGVEGYGAEQRDIFPVFTGRDSTGISDATAFAAQVMAAKPEMVELGDLVEKQNEQK